MQPLELLLQLGQLVVVAFSSATMAVRAPFTPRSSSSSFRWMARAVAVLRGLDQEHHEEGDDRRRGVTTSSRYPKTRIAVPVAAHRTMRVRPTTKGPDCRPTRMSASQIGESAHAWKNLPRQ